MSHTMIRDANVTAKAVFTKNGVAAHITVDGQFEHQFGPKSRVSQQLSLIPEKELSERLTGGDYFFINDSLVDFRDQHYNGFVHNDAALDSLMTTIGFTELTNRQSRATHRMLNRTASSDIALSKQWSKNSIEIPMYKSGGDFDSQLNFTWNPFQKNVSSVFELVRLICTNGMVGTTPFVNMQIPLVNRWEEHLNIANMQLQNKISNMMGSRLKEMSGARASVADLMILDRHITGRMLSKEDPQQNESLRRMYELIDPAEHLMKYYKPEVLDNKAVAAQLPSHLSVFDAWNIATEVCTHYNPTADSTDAGLQKLANHLVFDRGCSSTKVANIGNNIELSPFSSPERAFFGSVELV